MLGHVIVSPFNLEAAETHHHQLPMWLNLVDLAKVKAFVELTIASTVRQGAQSLFTVSACVCMHDLCVGVHARACVCMRVCCVCMCACMCCVCVCTDTHVCLCGCVCVCVCLCARE